MYKRILTAVTAIVLLCLPTAWAADTSATAAILMDGDTGEVLYEKNPDRQMLIASTTKLMTTLVVLERGGLGDVVTVTQQHIAQRRCSTAWTSAASPTSIKKPTT